jgi:hypothetical protein
MNCRSMEQSDHTSNQLFLITHPIKSYEKV